jgi:hypothetical protein
MGGNFRHCKRLRKEAETCSETVPDSGLMAGLAPAATGGRRQKPQIQHFCAPRKPGQKTLISNEIRCFYTVPVFANLRSSGLKPLI